ncbi:MAG: hypothetical protein MJ230_01650 [bacterium]|nr:hypothetical protein [bacterium]
MKKKISKEEFVKQANWKLRQKEKEQQEKCFNTERLCQTMNEHGADIATVVAKMYDCGISDCEDKFISIMNGKMPNTFELRAICQAVNVSADYLLNLSDKVN